VNINNVPVARKLWAIVLLIVLALSFSAFVSQRLASNALREALTQVEVHNARLQSALRWRALVDMGVQALIARALTSDVSLTETLDRRIAEAVATTKGLREQIFAAVDTPREKVAVENILKALRHGDGLLARIEEVRRSGDPSALASLEEKQIIPAAAQHIGALDEFVSLQESIRDEVRAEALAHAKRAEWAGLLVVAAVACAGLVMLKWLANSITRPLGKAVQLARVVARGDLTYQCVDGGRGDEIGQLMQAMSEMSRRLNGVVNEVRHGVESVSTASTQITSGNHDLSARTEQMAANLQQTANSMEEITANISQAAEAARQASQLATAAAQSAARGGTVVAQVVTSMERIKQDSQRIADITGVIDSIAFQTNILALNAAVESARAGENGRGFAVVAGEVRTLAQRSADAAKEIKELINTSTQTVTAGHALVEMTGRTISDVVTGVQDVSNLIDEIATATSEQRDSICQINSAVGGLDQVTQQNAALVEESAAAAQSLRQQSQRLAQAMADFKLEGASIV
jgi:methyl-accepting chemotaxis protein